MPPLEHQLIQSIAAGRMDKAKEVASMILYPAGQEALFLRGSNFLEDGSQSI